MSLVKAAESPIYDFTIKHIATPLNKYDSAADQTRTGDPLVNSQLSFKAQYCATKLLYHAELQRRTITANPSTK